MSSCSKAPRGLFVLLRVSRIFTAISISPGPLLRHCSSCYTFRAGRNLPDKEFRYLRTVIVTAAVHRASVQSFGLRLTSPFNLPALGRCQLYTSPYGFAETCGFGNQSLEPIHCDPEAHIHSPQGHLIPKLRAKLPSS